MFASKSRARNLFRETIEAELALIAKLVLRSGQVSDVSESACHVNIAAQSDRPRLAHINSAIVPEGWTGAAMLADLVRAAVIISDVVLRVE